MQQPELRKQVNLSLTSQLVGNSSQNTLSALRNPTNCLHPLLEHDTQQIRLLSFDLSGGLALDTFNRSNCPEYIALSYAWGSPDEVRLISVNGHSFTIRLNLFLALSAILRQKRHIQNDGMSLEGEEDTQKGSKSFLPEGWRYFWIDAICINQDDTQERNHQVQIMGDIYNKAAFVMVVSCFTGTLVHKLNYLRDERAERSRVLLCKKKHCVSLLSRPSTLEAYML
jgi:hypothetical protein